MAFSEKEKQIMLWGSKNNKSSQEIKDAVLRFRVTGSPTGNQVNDTKDKSFISRVQQDISSTGKNIQDILSNDGQFTDQSALRRGTEATSQAFGLIPQIATEALPKPARGLLQTIGEKAKSAVDFIGKLIGNTELAQKFVTQHPDAAKNLEEIAGTLQPLGDIAGSILLAEGGAKLTGQTKVIAGSIASKTAEALKGISETGTNGIKNAISKTLNPSSIMQRVARISKGRQIKFKQTAGESVGDYLVKRGIFGNIDEITTKLHNRFTKSRLTADSALAELKGNFKPTPVKTALSEMLKRETKISSPGALSENFSRVRELSNKFRKEGLTMSEMNEVKRIFERTVKLDFLKQNLPDSIEHAKNIDTAMRKWQFNKAQELGLKNLPEINRETRLARQLLDDLGKEYAGSAGNNKITLTDWILLSGGDPTAVGGFLTKKLLSSKTVQSKIAQKLAGDPTIGQPAGIIGPQTIDGYVAFIRNAEKNQ